MHMCTAELTIYYTSKIKPGCFLFDSRADKLPLMMPKVLLASRVSNLEVAEDGDGTTVRFSNTRVMSTATDPFLQ